LIALSVTNRQESAIYFIAIHSISVIFDHHLSGLPVE
jgi:hypothetical protein